EVRDRFAGLGLTLMRAAEAAVEVGQGMRTAGRVGNARKNAFIDAVERVEAEIAAIRRYDRWGLKRVKDAVPVDRKPPPAGTSAAAAGPPRGAGGGAWRRKCGGGPGAAAAVGGVGVEGGATSRARGRAPATRR